MEYVGYYTKKNIWQRKGLEQELETTAFEKDNKEQLC